MHIRPLTRADFPACVTIANAAFIDDEFTNLLSPRRREFPNAHRRFTLQNLQDNFVKRGNWCIVCVDNVDGKEEILGRAVWSRRTGGPDSLGAGSVYLRSNDTVTDRVERMLRNCEERYKFLARLNPSIDHRMVQEFIYSPPNSDGGPFASLLDQWYLVSLTVHPGHQRKGVGAALVRWGFEKCREESNYYGGAPLPAALIASAPGVGLYLRLGFRTITWLSEELGLGGGAVMVWDETDTFVRPLKEGEPMVTKGGRPVGCVFRGKEERKLEALEKNTTEEDVIKLDGDDDAESVYMTESYTTESSQQGFVVTSVHRNTT